MLYVGFLFFRLPLQVTVVLGGGGMPCFRITDTTLQTLFRHRCGVAVMIGDQFLTCQHIIGTQANGVGFLRYVRMPSICFFLAFLRRLLLSAQPLRGYAVYVRPCGALTKQCSPYRMCVAAIAGCRCTIHLVYTRPALLSCPHVCPRIRCGLPILGQGNHHFNCCSPSRSSRLHRDFFFFPLGFAFEEAAALLSSSQMLSLCPVAITESNRESWLVSRAGSFSLLRPKS